MTEDTRLFRAAENMAAVLNMVREGDWFILEVRKLMEQYQKSGEPVSEADAEALVALFRDLSGREDVRGAYALELDYLTIEEVAPSRPPPPDWPGGDRTGRYLFIPAAGLSVIPVSMEGATWHAWFGVQCRHWRARQPATAIPRAVTMELAPAEAAIRTGIKRAASCPDHHEALCRAAALLRSRRRPIGDALTDWAVGQLGGTAPAPDRRKRARSRKTAWRNACIVGAVKQLSQLGYRVTSSDRGPGPACDVVADVFELQAGTVLDFWKSR